ncbi:MAG: hypothetical protein GX601_03780, partial [Anaerolineales bacterium]|nr:hypothetical protein [Anaerolineales bacterium]
VNRRALESLIKVGALEGFGARTQLLAAIDRMLGFSGDHHRAKDAGQMSLFGEATGVRLSAADTLLAALPSTADVPRKEILAWEKDLVGVYISEHPLQQTMGRLQDVVTTTLSNLKEEPNGQQVVVVAMVQRVRRHLTKKGDEMAFVSVEDLDTACDVVVFPRLWRETRDLWEPERILILSGKVDMRRSDEPSLLCDWAKLPEQMIVAAGSGEQNGGASAPVEYRVPEPEPPPFPVTASSRPAPQPSAVQPTAGQPTAELPPVPLPVAKHPPDAQVSAEQVVHVTLARTGEQTRDVRMLRSIHSLLADHPGQDRFVIQVVGGRCEAFELDFPNERTRCSPELVQRLAALVGADAVRVEKAGGAESSGH